jgi:hypothetical protein
VASMLRVFSTDLQIPITQIEDEDLKAQAKEMEGMLWR